MWPIALISAVCWRYSLFPLFHLLLKSVPVPQGLWPLSLSLTSSAHALWLICSCPAAVTPPPSHFPAAPSSKATRNVTAGRRTSPFIKSAHWALLLIAGNWWCVDLVPQSIKELKIDSHLTYVGVNVSWVNDTINGLIFQVQSWNRCAPMTFDNIRVLCMIWENLEYASSIKLVLVLSFTH